jgi:hypothetical protein
MTAGDANQSPARCLQSLYYSPAIHVYLYTLLLASATKSASLALTEIPCLLKASDGCNMRHEAVFTLNAHVACE